MNKQAAVLALSASLVLSVGAHAHARGGNNGNMNMNANTNMNQTNDPGYSALSGANPLEQSFQNRMGIRGVTGHNGTGFSPLDSAGQNYSQPFLNSAGFGGNAGANGGNAGGQRMNRRGVMDGNPFYNMTGQDGAGRGVRAQDYTMNGYNGAGIGTFDGSAHYQLMQNGPTAPNFMGASRSPYYNTLNNGNGNNQVRGNNLYQMNNNNNTAELRENLTNPRKYGWLGWFGLLGMFGFAGLGRNKRYQ
ncbi:hypothetical protein [Paenibacillus gansuensis]|uniref:MYXO-CTERM domain-containing protein n=1 Tax=Paenibacillus gansuensis TaxID=306542 RepID=A0ABW5PC18_9BACL